jgi:lysozyme family protein
VPAGRPAAGSPPFTWEQSAADALELAGIASVKDWSVPRQGDRSNIEPFGSCGIPQT